jgi:anti-sigma regulatory factor (Ser/Thr protein kinase)
MDVQLRFLVPSHPRFLPLIRTAAGELGTALGLPDHECRGLSLAVDEALANIIRHAYRGKTNHVIEVNCHVSADCLEITILDQGDPPDPARLAAELPDEDALGGRGMHLIRTIMDEVCYEQVPGGNQVRLSKRLPVAGTGAASEGKDIWSLRFVSTKE